MKTEKTFGVAIKDTTPALKVEADGAKILIDILKELTKGKITPTWKPGMEIEIRFLYETDEER